MAKFCSRLSLSLFWFVLNQLQPFFKLLKMGVPEKVVEQKMLLQQFSIDDISTVLGRAPTFAAAPSSAPARSMFDFASVTLRPQNERLFEKEELKVSSAGGGGGNPLLAELAAAVNNQKDRGTWVSPTQSKPKFKQQPTAMESAMRAEFQKRLANRRAAMALDAKSSPSGSTKSASSCTSSPASSESSMSPAKLATGDA